MSKFVLYHGSNKKIEKPIFGKGKVYNDYGQGFYCTEHIELAKEWSCNEGVDGFSNEYELDMSGFIGSLYSWKIAVSVYRLLLCVEAFSG